MTIGRADIERAVVVIRRGGVVCFPTETFYGLGADALNPAAVERVVDAKARRLGAAIAVIVPDLDTARGLWGAVSPALEALARAHWPGALTLVAPARPGLPAPLVGPSGGVGARVSSHPVAQALAAELGGPITATSANLGGRPPAENVAAARDQLGDSVDLYLDGGPAQGGAPSTIVELSPAGRLRLVRPGAVPVHIEEY